ncbi:hypothetical protein [Paenibacillus popilliae]|uniref:Tail fiber protein n=1 Tax=Paenibacillus popilliae TaxID=78057 RepID=A0ABY3AJZ1_PAEPP|nr:hypothetical protein [Paenibacillus sp. SDF0028]TQR42802.1 hypothetical protein C7Y44_22575 [Paenibacillus sp. SDF0028]
MAFEKELPQWKGKGVKPPQSKLDEGWKVQDKPPAAWLNWQMNKTYEALKEVHEKAAEKTDVTKTLKDAKDYTDQKVKDIDLSKITPESIGALPIAGGTVRGNLGLQGSNGALQFQSGTGDNATYETYNNAIQAHWGLAMKTYDGTVTGLWDSRMGRWVTKGGHVVQNNSGVQWSVDTNGEQSMNGNLYANKQIHAAGRVWVGKTTQFGNEASCTLTLGDTDTGLNWVGDGQFDIMSNAQAAAKVNGGQMSFRMADGSYKTANDLFQSGVNAKQGTVDALNSKGIAASTNDSWSSLIDKIRKIPLGGTIQWQKNGEVAPYGKTTFNLFTMPANANYMALSFYGMSNIRLGDNTSSSSSPRSNYSIFVRNDFGQQIWINTVYNGSEQPYTVYLASLWVDRPGRTSYTTRLGKDDIGQPAILTVGSENSPNFRWEGNLYFDLELSGGNHASYGKSTFNLFTTACTT